MFWKFADVEREEEDSPTADEASRRLVLARGYSVFNAAHLGTQRREPKLDVAISVWREQRSLLPFTG